MSAASFRRAGQLDDCRGAIAEAETVDADNPDVWVQVRCARSRFRNDTS